MSSIADEIRQHQIIILELEKQEKSENDNKTSIDYNFKVINDVLDEKKGILQMIDIQSQCRVQEVREYREQRPPHARWGGYALQVELEGRASVAQA